MSHPEPANDKPQPKKKAAVVLPYEPPTLTKFDQLEKLIVSGE